MRPDALIAAARDVHLRAVEQGAVLLAAPWGTPSVVLQMQRGNLEGVAPRLLVLVAILVALDAGRYQEAWQLATRNRIDLNLLVDYCWPRMVDQVAAFVQVGGWVGGWVVGG
jgi:elongator complex protein 1